MSDYISEKDLFGEKPADYVSENQVFGPPKRTLGSVAKDTGVSVMKGLAGAGEAVVGLADIPTGGRVGKALDSIGMNTKVAREYWDDQYSPAQQEANRNVEQAEGFVPTVKSYLDNPSTIWHQGVEQLPAMALGGAGGAALKAGATKLIPSITAKVAPQTLGVVAGAAGEGLISAGQSEEQIRQQSKEGTTTMKQGLMAAGSGLGTSIFGFVGGRLAQKLNIVDPDTLAATLSTGAKKKSAKDVAKAIIGGGISESVFEEMPQSIQEQIWQNAATDRPLMEGTGTAAGAGGVLGFAMGAGANLLPGDTATQSEIQPGQTVPQQDLAADPDFEQAVAGMEPGPGLAASDVDADLMQEPGEFATQEQGAGVVPEPLVNAVSGQPVQQGQSADPLENEVNALLNESLNEEAVEPVGGVSGLGQKSLEILGPPSTAMQYAGTFIGNQPTEAMARAEEIEKRREDSIAAFSSGEMELRDLLNQWADDAIALAQIEEQRGIRNKRPALPPGQGFELLSDEEARDRRGDTLMDQWADDAVSLSQREEQKGIKSSVKQLPLQEGVFEMVSPAESAKRRIAANPDAMLPKDIAPAESIPNVERHEVIDNPDSVAHGQEVNTQPSEAQKDAGNYKKSHVNLDGMDISIENPAGSFRSGTDPDGKAWQTEMKTDYGYIKGSKGYDKDHVDIMIARGYQGGAQDVFVVNQHKKDGSFDEHKAVIGASDEAEAMALYNSNYEPGWDGGKSVARMSIDNFRDWAMSKGPERGPVVTQENLSDETQQNSAPSASTAGSPSENDAAARAPQGATSPSIEPSIETFKIGDHVEPVRDKDVLKPGRVGHIQTIDGEQYIQLDGSGQHFNAKDYRKVEASQSETTDDQPDTEKDSKKIKAAQSERTNAAMVWLQLNEPAMAMAELKDKPGYISIAESELAGWLSQTKEQADKSNDKILAAAIDYLLVDGKVTLPAKFFEDAYKSAIAKVKQEGIDRAIRRAAEQLEESLQGKGLSGDAADNFREGWNHAISGKSRSSLRLNDDITAGYDAAREFLKTPQGKNIFKKEQKKKLEGTGVDLTRVMDKKRADINATESTEAIVKKLMAATNRASLFKGIASEDATPGAQKLVSLFRDYFYTFGDYLRRPRHLLGRTYGEYLGRKAGNEDVIKAYLDLRIHRYDEQAGKTIENETKEERVELLKNHAEDYTTAILEITSKVRGENVKDLAIAITDAIVSPDQRRVNSKGSSWIDPSWGADKYFVHTASALIDSTSEFGRYYLVRVDGEGNIVNAGSQIKQLLELETSESLKRKSGTPLMPPKFDRVTRKGGKDYRKGRNITPEEFKKTFGFVDIGFGDYVAAQEDQDHLNYAYDAFMDLADILGMPPKAMSIAGRLYFSIGNLGHGKASAHYNSAHPHPTQGTVPVINVTNTRGDGTVSHEWAHALDLTTRNMRLAFSAVRGALMNTMDWQQVNRLVTDMLKGTSYWKGDGKTATKQERIDNAMRVYDYYARKQTRTKFFKDALALDGVKTSTANAYWSNEKEILARAFEAWVSDKLDSLGRKNTYLVNPEWVGDGKVTPEKGHRGTPYPTGDERKLFNRFFDAMVESLVVDKDTGEVTINEELFRKKAPEIAAENRKKWDAIVAQLPQMADEIERDMMAQKREETTRRETAKSMKVGDIVEPRENAEALSNRMKVTFPATVVGTEGDAGEYWRRVNVLDNSGAEVLFYARDMRIITPAEEVAKVTDTADLPAEATATTSSKLSDADLEDIFNEALNEVQESTQELPDEPPPGADIAADLKVGMWTREDIQEIRDMIADGKIIMVGDKDLGIPTIHDWPSDKTKHHGFGAFTTETDEYQADWDGGGMMEKTVGGRSFTRVGVRRGTITFYDNKAIIAHLDGLLGVKREETVEGAQPKKAAPPSTTPPSLDTEQQKTVKKLAAEALKLGVEGIDEAMTGLVKLFGGGKSTLMSFPAGFDEDTYRQAKPHFSEALKKFQAAGQSLKDLFVFLIKNFGAGIKPYALRFAKDEGLTRELGEKASASKQVAEFIADRLAGGQQTSWQELFAKSDWAWRGTQAENSYTSRDAYDAMEMGVNLYLRNSKEMTVNQTASQAADTVRELTRITGLLPTQTKRTKEQEQFQQFSTPPALAYVANWVAKVGPRDVMMEPSAGTGDLAIWSEKAGASLILNELSSRRAGLLRELFPNASILTEDGLQLNNVLAKNVMASVVVMNPPFSSTAGRTARNDTMNGAKHLEQALKRLAPGGRLVAIVGEGMGPSRPAFLKWWGDIKSKYNVRANISISGAEYAKYGTTFDNQIVVIDNTGKTMEEPVTVRVDSVADLPNILEGIRNERQEATEYAPPQHPSREDSQGGQDTDLPGSDGNLDPDALDDRGRPGDRTAPGMGGTEQLPGSVSGSGRGGPGSGSTRPGSSSVPGGGRGKRGGDSDDGRGSSQPDTGGSGVSTPGGTSLGDGVSPGEISVEDIRTEREGELTDSIFETYKPQRLSIPGAKEHPGPLVQSAAMASVDPPSPTYTPNLPKEVISKGLLSLPQLEAVVYAGQAHNELLPDGRRRGFFIGDNTGVGKGREISGIILDNFRQGRKKAVWVSKSAGLIADARRDFGGIGGDPKSIFATPSSPNAPIAQKEGILFITYDTLRTAEKQKGEGKTRSRLDQLLEWLGSDYDGVIAFDEAHAMGNATQMPGVRGKTKPSANALTGVKLQDQAKNARVVYVSATGATEVKNLSYATRLGLWGENTPFANVVGFVSNIVSGGVAAMEMVARDMKALGSYIARSLSFDGVQYRTLRHNLSAMNVAKYDELAKMWQIVLKDIHKALADTGGDKSSAKKNAMGAFWGAQQRFFNQILTAMQTPAMIEDAKKQLADGKSVVVQLTNHYAGQAEREVAQAREEGRELEELDLTPRQMLDQFLRNSFPTQQFEEQMDQAGNTVMVPVVDSQGKPVHNADAVAAREKLLETLSQITIPGNPIDTIIEELGKDNVAEITGRNKRYLTVRDGKGGYKVVEEKRGKSASKKEASEFQDGKRRVLIFSGAGATGFSFHADNTAKNKQQRVHYVLQPGWRADSAVQGFGRTHRTNQASAPEYVLVSTDVQAQKRFVSSIARRLDQLGALTKGQRETSGGLFNASDNLESKYGQAALVALFTNMANGYTSMNFDEVIEEMGLTNLKGSEGQFLPNNIPEMTKFLNRLLSLTVDRQNEVFGTFFQYLDEIVTRAVERGTYDTGLQTIKAQSIVKNRDEVVFTDDRTGATTRFVEVSISNPVRFRDFEAAKKWAKSRGDKFVGWFSGPRTKIFGLVDLGERLDKDGSTFRRGEVVGIVDDSVRHVDNVLAIRRQDHGYKKIENEDDVRQAWEKAVEEAPKMSTNKTHMLVGVLMPIWDRIVGSPKIYRMQTDSGEVLLGRTMSGKDLQQTMKNLGVGSDLSGMSPQEILAGIRGGATAVLANGWNIKQRMVSGDNRIEVMKGAGRDFTDSEIAILKDKGAFHEIISWKDRVFIPQGESAAAVFESITKANPVVELEGGGATGEAEAAYSKTSTGKPSSPASVSELTIAQRRQVNRMQRAGKIRLVSEEEAVRVLKDSGRGGKEVLSRDGKVIEGYALPSGEVYLIPKNIEAGSLWSTIRHEIGGHVSRMMRNGRQFNRLLYSIDKRKNEDSATGKAIRAAMKRVPDDTNPAHYREEVLAYMLSDAPDVSIVRRFIAMVKDILVKLGFNPNILTVEDLAAIADAAIRREAGMDLRGRAGGIKQSVREQFRPVAVDTSAFRKWFGSSVIKKDGKPFILYHGTADPRFLNDPDYDWTFDTARPARQGSSPIAGLGIFLGNETIADAHSVGTAGATHPFYVRMERPYVTTAAALEKRVHDRDSAKAFKKQLQELGDHDGIIIRDRGQVIAFDPNQLKSATHNTGAYSRDNDDVRFSKRSAAQREEPVNSKDEIERMAAEVIGRDRLAIINDIHDNGLNAKNEQQLFDDIIEQDPDAATPAKEKWLSRLKALPGTAARNSLALLTLRQMRDIYSDVAPVKDFYDAVNTMAADSTKIMSEADEIYNTWAALPGKVADIMSNLMTKATVAGVNPDRGYEPRANVKLFRKLIDESADVLVTLENGGSEVEGRRKWHEDRIRRLTHRIENERARFKAHKSLSAQFDALPKEAKDVYQAVRGMYDRNLERVRDALMFKAERIIKDPKAAKLAMEDIRLKFDAYIKEGPYFPLSRFGEYVVTLTDAAGRREVHTFDFMGQRDRAIARWSRETDANGQPRWKIKMQTAKEYSRETDGASSQFVVGVANIINQQEDIDAAEKNRMIDEVNQLYIRSMPDLSHRKHFAHRKKVEGFSRDQIRAFAQNMQHAAHHIARIRHADKLITAMTEMSETVKTTEKGDVSHLTDLYNELTKRHEILMNPKISPVAQALTSFGFVWNIGPSIASALVNISQTPLVAFPVMAARFNSVHGAFGALRKASAEYFMSPLSKTRGFDMTQSKKLSEDEKKMLQRLIDDGTIDVTLAHDLAQATAPDVLNMARTKHGSTMVKAMRLVSYPFHVAELANRQITAVAAYRLALRNGLGHEGAIDQAREVILDTHFDYRAQNRARFMEGNVQRVLFLFKQYSQQMTYLLGRSFWLAAKGESPEVKSIARKQLLGILGGHFMVSGLMGMPVLGGIGAMLQFAAAALGDDDEPWDWKVALRNMAADAVGKDAGEMLAHGAWRGLPVVGNWDISSRVSLGDLWLREPNREAEGIDQWNQYLNLLLGPLAGNGAAWFQGMATIADGKTGRGLEMMLPKAIKDAMKTFRYAREGVTSWNDATLIDEVNNVELFGQALGFTPRRVSEMYEGKSAVKNLEARLQGRREQLVNRWVDATRAGDTDAANAVMREANVFSQKNPALAITGPGLRRSMRQRAKVQAQTKNGIYIPATRKELLQEGRFANI